MREIIETALNDLNDYLKDSNWFGRENEVVNLFAHTFLQKHTWKRKIYFLCSDWNRSCGKTTTIVKRQGSSKKRFSNMGKRKSDSME